jgi:hypothetical protein
MKTKELYNLVSNVFCGYASKETLRPVLDFFEERMVVPGTLVTDGFETREIVLVYEKTVPVAEFVTPVELVTKVVWALGPCKESKGIGSQYVLTDCDPIKWKFV